MLYQAASLYPVWVGVQLQNGTAGGLAHSPDRHGV